MQTGSADLAPSRDEPERCASSLPETTRTGSRALDLARLPYRLRIAMIGSAIALLIGTAIASVYSPIFGILQFYWSSEVYFVAQDERWLVAIAFLLVLLAAVPLPVMGPVRWPPLTGLILGVAVFIVALVGARLVFDGFPLSRDEVLADFDAVIFRSGHLIAPIDPVWRRFAAALAPRFMLPIPSDVGFASDYLPINAALRALVGAVAPTDWTGPLLGVVALLATFGCARRLWPERRDVAALSALLVASSPQVLVTAMTGYAMSAHLALNMLWLWFFLRNDRTGHGGALATGFFACGVHQLIFHPLFVAPFIWRLWSSDRRPLAHVYLCSYAAFCVFWICYWKLVLAIAGIAPQTADQVGPLYFVVRVIDVARDFDWAGLSVMLKNLLRFADWQNPAALLLCVVAFAAVRRRAGVATELFAGIALTIAAMFVLLPYQGQGWGYRYLHGFIGSIALLAAYGWLAIDRVIGEGEAGAARSMLAICTVCSWLFLFPAHATEAHDFVRSYAAASAAIEGASTDLVLVDKSNLAFGEDLVRNDPFLRNRPIIMDLARLSVADVDYLCSHYSISVFDYDQAISLGIAPNNRATEVEAKTLAGLRDRMARNGCGATPVIKIASPGK